MRAPLTRQNLRGIWCALILPWDDRDGLDANRFVAEVAAYARTGVHGVYTGGTTGEFYAQDDATFQQVTELACAHAHAIDLPVQIGCTGLSTRTVHQRVRVAVRNGADGIQLALPFWLELSDDEVFDFLRSTADAAEGRPLILYITGRAKKGISPALLGQLAVELPALIGTKDVAGDAERVKQILAVTPDLAIFGGDADLLEKITLGTAGAYCSVTGLNPRRIVEYYHQCVSRQTTQAEVIRREIDGMMQLFERWARDQGLHDSALDRILRVAGGVDVGLRCQRPYRSASAEHVRELLAWCREHAPLFLPAHEGARC